jgi:hypothetical protein
MMKDFIERQMEVSDRLFKVMFEDHKERMKEIVLWAEMNAGLMRKLQERDAEIDKLKAQLNDHIRNDKL